MSTPVPTTEKQQLPTLEEIYDLACQDEPISPELANVSKRGYTTLHHAAFYAYPEPIERLVAAGADLTAKLPESGDTPLHHAVSYGNTEAVQAFLTAGCDLLIKNEKGELILLANIQNAKGNTPLHLAVEKGVVDTIPLLLAAGANPHITNNEGNSALHIAAREGLADAIPRLVAAGADPNAKNADKRTPLQVGRKNLPTVQALLAAGADPCVRYDARTSLLLRVSQDFRLAQNELIEIIEALAAAGAGLWECGLAARKSSVCNDQGIVAKLSELETSILTEPYQWQHLNFKEFPQEEVLEVEKCLVILAAYYDAHPNEPKPLKSVSFGNLRLTTKAVEALNRCISASNAKTVYNFSQPTYALPIKAAVASKLFTPPKTPAAISAPAPTAAQLAKKTMEEARVAREAAQLVAEEMKETQAKLAAAHHALTDSIYPITQLLTESADLPEDPQMTMPEEYAVHESDSDKEPVRTDIEIFLEIRAHPLFKPAADSMPSLDPKEEPRWPFAKQVFLKQIGIDFDVSPEKAQQYFEMAYTTWLLKNPAEVEKKLQATATLEGIYHGISGLGGRAVGGKTTIVGDLANGVNEIRDFLCFAAPYLHSTTSTSCPISYLACLQEVVRMATVSSKQTSPSRFPVVKKFYKDLVEKLSLVSEVMDLDSIDLIPTNALVEHPFRTVSTRFLSNVLETYENGQKLTLGKTHKHIEQLKNFLAETKNLSPNVELTGNDLVRLLYILHKHAVAKHEKAESIPTDVQDVYHAIANAILLGIQIEPGVAKPGCEKIHLYLETWLDNTLFEKPTLPSKADITASAAASATDRSAATPAEPTGIARMLRSFSFTRNSKAATTSGASAPSETPPAPPTPGKRT